LARLEDSWGFGSVMMALCDQLEAQLATTVSDRRRLLEAVLMDALQPSPVAA